MKNKIALIKQAALLVLLSTLNHELSTLHAQGTAFTYQGRLNDGSAPANGSYDLRFTIYDLANGGSQAGPTLTNSATAITNGLFTVTLDFGSQFPGANRWLEISVRTNGGGAFNTLAPRQPLTPAPYAITAGNLSGTLPATQLTGTLPNAQLSASVSLLGASIESAEITDGTITTSDLNASVLNGTFWKLGGNAGANPANGNFIGTTDNQPLELRVNGLRALRIEPTVTDTNRSNIVNVVGGSPVNFVSNGVYGATIGGGGAARWFAYVGTNSVTADFGTVSGGLANSAKGIYAMVGGGFANTASGGSATVTDGATTIGGGSYNFASGGNATIGGGIFNYANGFIATVGGGFANNAGTNGATVGGGEGNNVSGFIATVGGGFINTANGSYATVPGGRYNDASGYGSFAAGQYAKANHAGAFVWADSQGIDHASTSSNQFLIRAEGGVGINNNSPQAPLHVTGGGDASLSAGGNFISGLASGQNIVIDNNEIISRNNGAASDLILNSGSGNVGIGRTPAANRLEVGGEASKATAGNWLANSDARIKTGVQTVTNALDKLSRVRLVQFRYTDDYRAAHPGVEDRAYLNVVAQEFQKVFPEDVKRSGEKLASGDDILQVDTYPLTIYSAAAVQELNRKVEAQRAENAELKARLTALEKLITDPNARGN